MPSYVVKTQIYKKAQQSKLQHSRISLACNRVPGTDAKVNSFLPCSVLITNSSMCGGWRQRIPTETSNSQDTTWVSFNSAQFWLYLPGDSIRLHKLRAQSHKNCPFLTSDTSHKRRLLACTSDQPAINGGSNNSECQLQA